MRNMQRLATLTTLPLLLIVGACSRDSQTEPREPTTASQTVTSPETLVTTGEVTEEPDEAQAKLIDSTGREIGKAKLSQEEDGVKVVVELDQAPPGHKGVHVHEKGDCSNLAAKSMGDHFAPETKLHALPTEQREADRHLGDLGNIEVEDDGTGKLEIKVKRANIKPNDALSYLGRALVVHTGADSGSAKQPSGDSGQPFACGVIEST